MNDTSDENSMEAPTKKTTQTLYNINIVHTLVKTTTHEQGNWIFEQSPVCNTFKMEGIGRMKEREWEMAEVCQIHYDENYAGYG